MSDGGRRRRSLRCKDLLSRDAFVVTEVDTAGGGVLLHIPGSGSKAVRLSKADVDRLIGNLAEARDAADDSAAS